MIAEHTHGVLVLESTQDWAIQLLYCCLHRCVFSPCCCLALLTLSHFDNDASLEKRGCSCSSFSAHLMTLSDTPRQAAHVDYTRLHCGPCRHSFRAISLRAEPCAERLQPSPAPTVRHPKGDGLHPASKTGRPFSHLPPSDAGRKQACPVLAPTAIPVQRYSR